MKFLNAVLAVTLAAPMGASAALAPGYLGDLRGQSLVVGNTVQGAIGTAVADVYSFDIDALGAETVAAAVEVSVQFGTSITPILDIANFAVVLRDMNGVEYAFDNTLNASGAAEFQTMLAPSTAGLTGFYELVVTGVTAGSVGGAYLGTLSAQAAPEPKQWMLMLSGLGLVGLMVERVKRRQF